MALMGLTDLKGGTETQCAFLSSPSQLPSREACFLAAAVASGSRSRLFGCIMEGRVPGIGITPSTLMPDGDSITDDYLWPSGANFEVGPTVQSFDVPLSWTNRIPLAQAGQTGPPLITPDGGNIASDALITLFLNHSCGKSASIYYTIDGEVPVPHRSKRYAGPFTLSKKDVWFQPEHVVVGAVAICPRLRPSPVNSRWFYAMPRTPPPVIRPEGMFNSCHPVRVNVTGRGILRYTVSLQGLNVPVLNLTESGCDCDLPFTYRGEVHNRCTDMDWPGTPWCYVKGSVCGTSYFNRRFDRCRPFDPINAGLRVPALNPPAGHSPLLGAEFNTLVSLVALETQTAILVEARVDSNEAPLLVPGKIFKFQERHEGHFFVPSGYTAYTAVIATMDGATPSLVTTSNVTVSCPSHPTAKPTPTPMPTPTPSSTPAPTPTPTSPRDSPTTTPAATPAPDPLDCPPCVNPNASAPIPMSYPDRGVIAASMMVRLYSALGENGTIYYTTDGEWPTVESKRYTTPFFLTEDGQACQPAAYDEGIARGDTNWECYVTLRAFVAPVRKMRSVGCTSGCLCLRNSSVFTQVFHVLSA